MYVYLTELKLTAEKFSKLTGEDVNKLKKGLGIKEKSLNESSQDTIALSMNSVEGLEKYVNLKDVESIFVGTESQMNLSQPIATYLTQFTGNNVQVMDGIFACLSGLNFVDMSIHLGKSLVVTSDIAKYGTTGKRNSPSADFTGGAGSVAIKIGEPKLLEIFDEKGVYSSKNPDFHKPIKIKGDKLESWLSPVVDGQYSFTSYLYHIGKAYKNLKEKIDISLNDFSSIVFHVPFPKITKYVLSYLNVIDKVEEGHFETLIEELKQSFESKEILENYDGLLRNKVSILKEQLNNFYDEKQFNEKVAPSLVYPSKIGNIYTGSVFLSLASCLKNKKHKPDDLILVLGYGSGSGSLVKVMKTTTETQKIVDGWDIDERLKRRKEVSVKDYVKLREKGIVPGEKTSDGWYLKSISEIDKRREYVRV